MTEIEFKILKESYSQAVAQNMLVLELIKDHEKKIFCKQCQYYKGVHDNPGHGPCTYWKAGFVMWDDFCSKGKRVEKKNNQ